MPAPAPQPAPPLAIGLATFFGTGFFPWAPATLASLIVSIVYHFLPAAFFAPPGAWLPQGLALLVVTFIGVISATLAEKQLGLDAGPIVIDEVAGMIVTYLLVPMPAALLPRLAVLGVGFVAFRVFDILKPWPVDRIQNLPGGWGIMADDLLAGVYSNVAVRLALLFVLPHLPGLH